MLIRNGERVGPTRWTTSCTLGGGKLSLINQRGFFCEAHAWDIGLYSFLGSVFIWSEPIIYRVPLNALIMIKYKNNNDKLGPSWDKPRIKIG